MPAEQAANPMFSNMLIPYALIFAVFYFLVIKPQKDKQKQTKAMLDALKKNDQVVTAGGAHGTVVMVKEKTVILRVDENVKIEFDKESISSVTKQRSASSEKSSTEKK